MNKESIPQGFPVGRVRLTKHLSQAFRQRTLGGQSRQIPMITPYGGLPPGRKPGSTLQGDARSIASRREGTLSQFVAAKNNPQDIRTQHPPTLSTGPDGSGATPENVSQGSGQVRDANVQKVAHLLRERVARLRV